MRAVSIACVLMTLAGTALARPTLDERIDILWERAVRQSDFAKYDDMLETGRRAVVIAPASAEAWALRAWTTWMHPEGRGDIALAHAQRALGIDPDCGRARMVLGLIIPFVTEPPDFARSISELEAALRLDPTLAEAWSRLGLARSAAGDPEAGVADVRRAIELEPHYFQWHLHLGEILLVVGEAEEAVAANRLGLERAFSPFTQMMARNNLTWSLCMMLPDDPALRQEALSAARELAAQVPDHPEVLDTLGTAELLFGEAPRAERALRAAGDLGKHTHAALAYALALQGKTGEARERLTSFSALHVRDLALPEEYRFAGLAWEALGEPRITRRIFERATERWPSHPWADEMREWLAEH